MMNIDIQPIQETDFAQIFSIETAAHTIPWSLGTLKNNQGENYLNLKLLQQDQIVGFCICQMVLDEATLFNIAITPQSQGKGLGKTLLQSLMAQLREKGINTLWLEVRESNKKAQCLYQTLGFNEVSLRKNYYPLPDGGREHAIIMACYL